MGDITPTSRPEERLADVELESRPSIGSTSDELVEPDPGGGATKTGIPHAIAAALTGDAAEGGAAASTEDAAEGGAEEDDIINRRGGADGGVAIFGGGADSGRHAWRRRRRSCRHAWRRRQKKLLLDRLGLRRTLELRCIRNVVLPSRRHQKRRWFRQARWRRCVRRSEIYR